MSMQQFCLRWNNHQPNFISVFSSLLNNETLVDVTLAAEGRHLQAHKVVLSACSTYFQSLFTVNPCQHPIVILKDVKFSDLKIMVDFMYYGEVNVSQDQLPSIIKVIWWNVIFYLLLFLSLLSLFVIAIWMLHSAELKILGTPLLLHFLSFIIVSVTIDH